MRIFRSLIAIAMAVLLAPLVPLLAALGVAWASGCPMGWENAVPCSALGRDIGSVIDILVRLGVPGLLTGRLAMLVFALWTIIELVVICLRRPSGTKRRPASPAKH